MPINEEIKRLALKNCNMRKILDIAENIMKLDLNLGEFKILLAILDLQFQGNLIDHHLELKDIQGSMPREHLDKLIILVSKLDEIYKDDMA